LEYLGLEVAVKSLCRELSQQSRIVIGCSCRGIPAELDSGLALGCLRVVQEALHNVVKHSGATDVHLEVLGNEDSLSLTVSDNGAGFDAGEAGARGGLGLISMRERMHLIGGDFTISSAPGQGTRIKAWAPLTSKPAVARAAHNS
jgi:signal transduction histidine kinase